MATTGILLDGRFLINRVHELVQLPGCLTTREGADPPFLVSDTPTDGPLCTTSRRHGRLHLPVWQVQFGLHVRRGRRSAEWEHKLSFYSLPAGWHTEAGYGVA